MAFDSPDLNLGALSRASSQGAVNSPTFHASGSGTIDRIRSLLASVGVGIPSASS